MGSRRLRYPDCHSISALKGYLRIVGHRYLLKAFSFGTCTAIFTGISPSFGKEPVFVDAVVANDNARSRKMEDGNAGANGEVGAVEVGNDWRIRCGSLISSEC